MVDFWCGGSRIKDATGVAAVAVVVVVVVVVVGDLVGPRC